MAQKMTDETRAELLRAATESRTHANNLRDDIKNAGTRIEHMRLTRLALEAEALAATLSLIAARPEIDRAIEADGFVTVNMHTGELVELDIPED